MASRYDAKVGDTITLDALFKIEGVAADVFKVSRVELTDKDFNVLKVISSHDVIHVGTGHYRVVFADVSVPGELTDHWFYQTVEAAEAEELVLHVTVTNYTGEVGEGPAPTAPVVPAAGLDAVCLIEHRFFDAGGNGMQGVYLRFRPDVISDQTLTLGTVAKDIDAVSDVNGYVSMYLMRNTWGTLAITGVGLVRRVLIPDQESAELYDLVANSDDLLEVQQANYLDLPRSS